VNLIQATGIIQYEIALRPERKGFSNITTHPINVKIEVGRNWEKMCYLKEEEY